MCPHYKSRWKNICPLQKDTYAAFCRNKSASRLGRTIEHGSRTVALRWSDATRGPSTRTSWQGPCRHCNAAGGFSVHRLHQDLKAQGHGLAKDTVHGMVGHLLDASLVSSAPLATESERQRNSNPRKFYPADPGLIPAFDSGGRSNVGRALETAVANELERRALDIGYVKTSGGREVDFLVRNRAGGTECARTWEMLTLWHGNSRHLLMPKRNTRKPHVGSSF